MWDLWAQGQIDISNKSIEYWDIMVIILAHASILNDIWAQTSDNIKLLGKFKGMDCETAFMT